MTFHKAASIVAAGCLVASAGVIAVGISPAEAAPVVQINTVKFDSDGPDRPVTNAKLNDEWVRIKNVGRASRSLKGWILKDASKHRYVFGAVTLAPGAWTKVHTGSGTDTPKHKYQDRGYYIWNNDGDTAKLTKSDGTLVDSCKWSGDEANGTKNC